MLTNKTLTSPVLNTAVSGTAILDEDDLSSDSATQLATQQSIKAYVDAQVTAQDLDLTSDSGTIAIDLDSETLTVAGGTGIDSSATSNTVTLAIDSTVVTLAGSQTLTNKTLTSPTLNTPTIGTSFTIGSATITEAELEVLDGATLTTTELNYVDGVTSAIQTQLDAKAPIATPTFTTSITIGSATISEAELEILDGATVTTTELNLLDGVTATTTELNYIDGVTSALQTQLDAKAPLASPTFTGTVTIGSAALNETELEILDGATLTTAELNTLDGITSSTSELNLLDGSAANTVVNSKAVIYGSSGELAGTLSTAAQANVTSVGTLTSLTISGDLTVDTDTLKVDSSNNRVGINQASPDVTLDLGANTDAVHMPVGTTAQRPGSPAAGYFRYNSETAKFEGYTDEWGSIAGGGSGTNMDTNIFAGDGSDTTFTLSTAPDTEQNLIVFVDGVFQAHDAYSVSGTTLTFSEAPANGRVITVFHSTTTVGGSNATINTMTGDNSDVTLTLSVAPVHENNTQVYFDGVYQSKSNYSISGTTLTFSTAPPTGVLVEAITLTNTSITTAAQLVDADADTLIQVEESSDEDKIRFDVAGSEKMVLDSTGLGIGETAPGSELHVKVSDTGIAPHASAQITLEREGTNYLQFLTAETGTSGILFGDGSDVDVGKIVYDHNVPSMQFMTETATAMTIDSSQKVGIGTTSPAETVHAYSTGNTRYEVESTTGVAAFKATNNLGSYAWYVDNSADKFHLYDFTDDTQIITFDGDGHVTMPLQPAFCVLPSSTQDNIAVTTAVTVVFGTERFDVGSNFASNTFTAPVTGKYQFNAVIRFDNADSAALFYQLGVITTNESYTSYIDPDFGQDTPYWTLNVAVVADMDANDTAYVTLFQHSGTQQTDVSVDSWFSGYLVA